MPNYGNPYSWFQQQRPIPVATPIDLLNMGYQPNHVPNRSNGVLNQLRPQMNPMLQQQYMRAEQYNPLGMFGTTEGEEK